jgi:thiol-disulfide isomerase/thioredoxin
MRDSAKAATPLAITLTSILCSIAGVAARRLAATSLPRSLAAAVLLVAALCLWVMVGVPRFVAGTGYHWSTRACPALAFRSLDGEPIVVSDPRGRVPVLAFWATWCLPCRWELPELVRIRRRFAADPRVAFWAVDVGWGPESPIRARGFLERRGLALPAAFDSAFTAQALGVHALPAIAVVDGRGRLRLTHAGFDRSEDLAGRLSRAIERVANESAGGR